MKAPPGRERPGYQEALAEAGLEAPFTGRSSVARRSVAGRTRRIAIPLHSALRTPQSALLLLLAAVAAVHAEPTASVSITSTPPQAQVTFDNRYVGITPLTLTDVGYGKHLVEVRKYQHADVAQVVEVKEPRVSVEVPLARLGRGRLRVTAVPEGAEVFLNGALRGKAPVVLDGLLPGRYEVRVEAESCFPFQGSVVIEADGEATVKAVLESKSEAFLLAAIQKDPTRVVNYYDLAHHYVRLQQFDKAFAMFARGFDACVSPNVVTSEQRRLYDEFERVWDGQYNFADAATRQQLRPRILEELSKAIERQPRNVLTYWSLGEHYEKLGDWAKSAETYERGVAAVKTRRARLYLISFLARARYRQGAALEKEQKWDEALALYERVLATYPETYYSRTLLTRVITIWERREKESAKAIEARKRFLQLYPDSDSCPDMLMAIAQTYANRLRDPEKAIETYRTYIATYPDQPGVVRARLAIAALYVAQKETDAAVREYEEVVARHPRSSAAPDALRAIYNIHARLAAPRNAPPEAKEKAEAARKRLIEEYPTSQEAAAVDTDPEARKARQEASQAYRDANALAKKDAPKAAAALVELARAEPASSLSRYALTQAIRLYSEQVKDHAKANAARQLFLELYPDSEMSATMLYQIAQAKWQSLDRFDEGVADLRRLVKEYPESELAVSAQYQIATLYSFRHGHYDREKNIEAYRKLIRDFPWYDGNDGAQLQIALNFYYQTQPGDRERCRKELMKLVETYPHGQYLAQAEYYLDLIDAGLQVEENRE